MRKKKNQERLLSMRYLLLIYCLFIVVIFVSFGIMSYQSVKQIENDVINNAERQLNYMDKRLDNAFQSIQFSVAGLLKNQDVANYRKIATTDETDEVIHGRERVRSSLQNAAGSSQVLGSAMVFYQSAQQYVFSNSMNDENQKKITDFLKEVDQSGWYRVDGVSLYYVNFSPFQARTFQTNSFNYAIAGKIRQDFIYDLLADSNNDADIHTFFSFSDGQSIQVNQIPKSLQAKIDTLIAKDDLPAIVELRLDGKNYQVLSRYNARTATWLTSYLDTSIFSKRMIRTVVFSGSILALLTTLAFLVLALFYSKIYRNMQNMFHALSAVEKGDYSARMPMSRDSDFNYVFLKYNTMLDQTERLLIRLKKETVLRETAEFRQLQAHINPHFLYNNLLFIMSMAETSPKAVVMMTSHLADYYRYVTKKNTTEVTLEQELTLAENYLTILALRKEIDFYVDYPEALGRQPFMQLVIQPLVENAIFHGVEMRLGSHEVNLVVEQEEEGYRISVIDDGVGLSNQRIEELYEQISKDTPRTDGSVGLWNVHQRLINRYGVKSGLLIQSDLKQKGYGTTVSMWIPIIKDGGT
ncbi:two-component system, sensor histidine kinase YesM [Enterococcus sp. AZ194]|uniref:sensor histidine kinase n=1 Tax=Enterococcus sp. AZ194 TaxID=2774629 RepID=UPI003F289F5F